MSNVKMEIGSISTSKLHYSNQNGSIFYKKMSLNALCYKCAILMLLLRAWHVTQTHTVLCVKGRITASPGGNTEKTQSYEIGPLLHTYSGSKQSLSIYWNVGHFSTLHVHLCCRKRGRRFPLFCETFWKAVALHLFC